MVLYRKYRSQSFSEIAGQVPLIQFLLHSLLHRHLHHAYLFSGPRGTGKTSLARILAKAINCKQPQNGEPCNQCSNCQEITLGTHLDVFEMDAASHRGIDDIRDIRDKVQYLPVAGHKKVYIIDEVHMLTQEAFNALLKTLEEPPEHVLFILATTELHKLPMTIRSRCQQLDFLPLDVNALAMHLLKVAKLEGIQLDQEVANALAEQTQGCVRDALVLLEQLNLYTAGSAIHLEQMAEYLGGLHPAEIESWANSYFSIDTEQMFKISEEWMKRGLNWNMVIDQIIKYLEKEWMGTFVSKINSRYPMVTIKQAFDGLMHFRAQLRYENQPRLLWQSFLWQRAIQNTSHVNVLEQKSKISVAEIAVPERVPVSKEITPEKKIESRPGNSLGFNDLLKKWPEFLIEVKKATKLYLILVEAKPVKWESPTLTLRFNRHASLHQQKILQAPLDQVFRSLFKEFYGVDVKIFIESDGELVSPTSTLSTPESKISQMFAGKILGN